MKSHAILIVGGAGYIGSHMTRLLCDQGYKVLVLDNLQSGYRDAVDGRAELIVGDISDTELLDGLLGRNPISHVIHMASDIQVGESVVDPAKYYRNNVSNTLLLLNVIISHNILSFVFSSSAAIFGDPVYSPIDEAHPKQPLSPYGHSKLMVEQVLKDFERAYGLRSVCLRYFNAAGAHPDGTLGERHLPETHLIPLVLQVASGERETITVFGTDYSTSDGTCIRDYIHIVDLCTAHKLAMDFLDTSAVSACFNLGNGQGFSVQQVIDTARRITGRTIPVVTSDRRPGDPDTLIADSTRARKQLGWQPMYADLDTIVLHAWQWEQQAKNWRA